MRYHFDTRRLALCKCVSGYVPTTKRRSELDKSNNVLLLIDVVLICSINATENIPLLATL